MNTWAPICALVFSLVCLPGCHNQVAQTTEAPTLTCTASDPSCPDSYVCDVLAASCLPEDGPSVVCAADDDCPDDNVCGPTFVCQAPDSSALSNGLTIYIIFGVVLGVIVIIVIIILVLSCGRWSQMPGRFRGFRGTRNWVSRPKPVTAVIVPKPRLRLGVKRNHPDYEPPVPEVSDMSKPTVFVKEGRSLTRAAEPRPITTSSTTTVTPAAAPYIAVVDCSRVCDHAGPSTSNSCSHHEKAPGGPCGSQHQNCNNVHSCGGHHNYNPVPQPSCSGGCQGCPAHASAGIYPRIGEPQHQINIQAPIPVHHYPVVPQPVGLYPNIGHGHAQLITPQAVGHLHVTPPAYNTQVKH